MPGFQVVERSPGRKPRESLAEVDGDASLLAAAACDGPASIAPAMTAAMTSTGSRCGVAVALIWLNLLRVKIRAAFQLSPSNIGMTSTRVRPQQKLGLTLTGEPLAADGHQPRPA
jgi:hypothetical protein